MALFGANPQILAAFERQFGVENGQLVYRRYGKGAAYRVTDEQRSLWKKQYRRRALLAQWGLLGGIGLIAIALTWYSVSTSTDPDSLAVGGTMFGATLLLIIAFFLANKRAMTWPERQLERETPLSTPLDPETARRKFFARLSFRQMAMAPLLAVGLIALQRGRAFLDPLHGWGLLGWLFVGGVSLLACLAAYRKWQAEQS
jgi:hypothetical protein